MFIGDVLEKFYTMTIAAEVIGVSRMTLWRWGKSGKVTVHHIGRTALIEKRVAEELKARR